ncbi:MAG: hypothetical protein K5919_04070 [Clostridiales bacterium]|nr:hypothetical protein [Clostridiales bacterium]
MRLLIQGDSGRDAALRRLAPQRGHTLPSHGPWDAVLLPLPHSKISEDAADLLPRGQIVVCGRTDAAFDCLAARRGWRLIRILEDPEFLEKNATLTAEGAVHAAMSAVPFALQDAECLVIGYGRIGKALTKFLRGLDVCVTVAARRPESRAQAGENSIPMTGISRALPGCRIVFNTVPVTVLTSAQLSLLPPGSLYVELASAPYGIAPGEAEKSGVCYLLESGLPGRYCPESAAVLLLSCIERKVSCP